ncbi:dehydrogenase/reductase SDR family member 7B-like [Paramacrobiotus metropolitanus]|uniref:dehydrogenase/reductase SDR family member 7B-like n=1 Tax=Paramacrobiotus metropolitanus TaxID=2943436 RepID=UPI002445B0AA|nr:dehydrogenase/reductase SDR family member 7B-like [Paramacrobiotus metropolitanus]
MSQQNLTFFRYPPSWLTDSFLAGIGVIFAAGAITIWGLKKLIFTRAVGNRSWYDLSGKVVCVTGATGGLGKALSSVLIARGAKVIVTGRNAKALAELIDELKHVPEHQLHNPTVYNPVGVELDLGNLDSIPAKAREILSRYGRVDVLIHNAGLSSRGAVMETGIELDKQLMTVNYLAPVALTKELLPPMVETGDAYVVAIGSVQGKMTLPFRSPYAASKHALHAFCECLRAEVQHQGVSVLVVSPGYIRTGLSLNALTGDGARYGKMDETIATGMEPLAVAEETIRSIEHRRMDVLICGFLPTLGIYMRTLWPSLYFLTMRRRAEKALKKA